MELMASESSALLVLSMQQVSIQIHRQPCRAASRQLSRILRPTKWRGFAPTHLQRALRARRSWKVCSEASQTCERIAYPPETSSGAVKYFSSARSVLSSHITKTI